MTEYNTRKAELRILDRETDLEQAGFGEPERGQRYKVTAARYRDHALVRVSDETRTFEVILALPDASRFVYIAIGGEHCYVHNILVESDGVEISPDDIPRIAEEISFIRNCPEGDVPNVQVDGWRTDATEGIPVGDGMTLTFHSMSLPTARLVWHCPFISVFSSEGGQVNGRDFREYMLLRHVGENFTEVLENTGLDFASGVFLHRQLPSLFGGAAAAGQEGPGQVSKLVIQAKPAEEQVLRRFFVR